MDNITRIVERPEMGESRKAVLPGKATLFPWRGTLPRRALTRNFAPNLTRNFAPNMNRVRPSPCATALREWEIVREGRQVRPEGGGTKGGSLTRTNALQIATLHSVFWRLGNARAVL
jgi:hypothetical protein